jgi:acyl-CoA hydrolase
MCSVGVAAEYLPAAIAAAPTILAEVNDQVPVVAGAPAIPFERLSGTIRTSRPLPGVGVRASGERGVAVSGHLATIVGDGATLQVGVGGLLDAALEGLRGRRDLRVHSGLMSDALRELALAGALDTRTGAVNATALLGTPELYAWAAGSGLTLRDVSWTHDPSVLAGLSGFFAINAALQVDLQGRINAEMAGGSYVGGVGGAPVFAHAARHSPGGGSVFILPSTTRSGDSRIVAALDGSAATTPAADVSFVVTEHGVADLRHATCDERARRLIAIAAPSSRDALRAAA